MIISNRTIECFSFVVKGQPRFRSNALMGSKSCAGQNQLCALRDAKLKVVADSKPGNTSV
jgi:hypothetical protein